MVITRTLDLVSYFLLLGTIFCLLSSFLRPDYSESRPLSGDVLVWPAVYGWLKCETVCQNEVIWGLASQQVGPCNPMLCPVSLHSGRWSMTRFRVAYASVTAYVPSWYRCEGRRVSYFLSLWMDISVRRTLHRNQVLHQKVVLVPRTTLWMWM